MADDSSPRLLLIVTGSTLRAEELDRPLAYYLKQKVERAAGRPRPRDQASVVVADFRWLNDEPLWPVPTISVGGPGVNSLAHKWFEEVPFSLAVDEQYCIQLDPDLDRPPRQHLGHGQRHHPDRRLRLRRPLPPPLPRTPPPAYIPDVADPEEADD